MVIIIVLLAIELAVVAIAWTLGGGDERAGARILLAMVVVTYVGHPLLGTTYTTVDPVGLTVDIVGLVGFCWLGLAARRFWPLWAASLQVLSTVAHLIRALEIPVRPAVYYWMKAIPTLGVLVLLLAATWLRRREQAKRKRRSSQN